MASPEIRTQLTNWTEAAKRGDEMTVSIDRTGRINLSRRSNDPDPIGTLRNRRNQFEKTNLRNGLIAGGLAVTTAAVVALIIAMSVNSAKRKRLLQQPSA